MIALCAVAGVIDFHQRPIDLEPVIRSGGAHRGPGEGLVLLFDAPVYVDKLESAVASACGAPPARSRIGAVSTQRRSRWSTKWAARVTFNGEIYNYLELGDAGQARLSIRSTSAVILYAYRE
jgi:asparagine synthetase B (glutamine-hydrolysing)